MRERATVPAAPRRGRGRARWLTLSLALAMLTACQTVPVPPAPVTAWSVRRATLQALDRFHLEGRVAVAVARQGFNADIDLTQRGALMRMTLSGPLGAGAIRVEAEGDDLALVNSRGQHLGSTAAHEAIERQLGFEPPLRSLRYWILGVPDPGAPAQIDLDAQHRLVRLQQAGWSIDYRAYVSVGAEWLPRLLSLQRAAVRLRMVVDGWQLQ